MARNNRTSLVVCYPTPPSIREFEMFSIISNSRWPCCCAGDVQNAKNDWYGCNWKLRLACPRIGVIASFYFHSCTSWWIFQRTATKQAATPSTLGKHCWQAGFASWKRFNFSTFSILVTLCKRLFLLGVKTLQCSNFQLQCFKEFPGTKNNTHLWRRF